MPKDTKTLGNNKARAWESLGFAHKKRLCQRFDTTSLSVAKHSSIIFFYYPGDIPVMQKVKGIPSFISFLEPSFLRFAYSHTL